MKTSRQTLLLALSLFCAVIAQAQVPKYNSYPSASAVIFLDFDGHTVSGTSWNVSGPIYCGASGLDSTKITTIFNRVSEDFRPFNVNITTDSTKYLAAPLNKRMRVILTVTSDWYGSAGGVAFVSSFTWGDDTPCFIFTALLNYNVKNISEACSHETGHTLGLYHQSTYDGSCNKISDYNYGQGSGEIGWAPIMGVGYYQNLTLWNNGPNSYGCTNYQSDLSVITSINGFGFRTDDHSASFGSATMATFSGNQFNVSGVIEQNTDQDLFRFEQPSYGHFVLDAIPYNVGTGNSGSDLDMQVTLYDATQTQLNVFNPGTLLSSVIDTLLNAGTYYLKLEGKGNMYAPNYASLGSYSLEGNFTAATPLPLRRLELFGELNGDQHILNWLIDADEQIIEMILEYSIDGRTFEPVLSMDESSRNYSYKPVTAGAIQYRLNVTFDNGRQYYSNIITLKSSGKNAGPVLLGNPVISNQVRISSPGTFDYMIYDLSGKVINKGRLNAGLNNLKTSIDAPGMYVIRFSNGGEYWSEKIMRQ